MKVTLERREFQRLLSFARRVATVRHPHVSLVAGDNFTVRAGDFTLSIVATTSARVHGTGACAVSATTLWHCVAGLKTRRVTLKATSSSLVLASSGQARFALNLVPAPASQLQRAQVPGFFIPCVDLIRLLESVSGFTAPAHANPLLSCVLFRFTPGSLTLQAADGHRFAMGRVAVDGDFSGDLALPASALDVVLKGLPSRGGVSLHPGPHELVFAWRGSEVAARAYDGQYPDIDALFPQQFTRSVRVGRAALMAAVKQVMPLAVSRVQLRLEPQLVCLRGRTEGLGAVWHRVPATLEGKPLRLAIEGGRLLKILQACRDEEVAIDVVDDRTMLRVRGVGNRAVVYMLVPLMPIRKASVEKSS